MIPHVMSHIDTIGLTGLKSIFCYTLSEHSNDFNEEIGKLVNETVS